MKGEQWLDHAFTATFAVHTFVRGDVSCVIRAPSVSTTRQSKTRFQTVVFGF